MERSKADVLMIACSKEHGRGFRTGYHEHTGASGFNHSINGKHGNIIRDDGWMEDEVACKIKNYWRSSVNELVFSGRRQSERVVSAKKEDCGGAQRARAQVPAAAPPGSPPGVFLWWPRTARR